MGQCSILAGSFEVQTLLELDLGNVDRHGSIRNKPLAVSPVASQSGNPRKQEMYLLPNILKRKRKITEKYRLTLNSNLERVIIFRDNKMNETKIMQLYRKTK